jgi:hypothetical protein
MFQTKRKAGIELNFFEYSSSKRYLAELDVAEYNKNKKPHFDLNHGIKTMKELGITLDCKDKTITFDGVKVPMQTSTTCRALALSVH